MSQRWSYRHAGGKILGSDAPFCDRGTAMTVVRTGVQCANVYAIPDGRTLTKCKDKDIIKTVDPGYCVDWRYVTRDRRWVMVRDTSRNNNRAGWVFMPITSFRRDRGTWSYYNHGTCNQVGSG
jgi:hypothetical protein